MRILPLLMLGKPKLDLVKKYSSITHSHPISYLSCFLYLNIAWKILNGEDKNQSVVGSINEFSNLIKDYDSVTVRELEKITSIDYKNIQEIDFESGTYVVDSMISSIYCLLHTKSYNESILKAVNLGGDTDTTAAIVGALTGIYYGKENIPTNWIENLVKNDLITKLI